MDYDGAVELIKKTEAYDTEQRSIKINLMDFEGKIPLKEYDYKEVAAIVNFVDKVDSRQVPKGATGMRPGPAPEQHAAPRVQAPAQPKMAQSEPEVYIPKPAPVAPVPPPPTPSPRQSTIFVPKPATPPQSNAEMQQAQKPVVRKPSMMEGLGAAAAEFKEAVSHLETRVGTITEKKSSDNFVLPNLSLSDQVNELEKINLGIDGNVFNHEQLEIIKGEVRELARTSLRHKAPQQSERQTVELRDKRLREALIKLDIK